MICSFGFPILPLSAKDLVDLVSSKDPSFSFSGLRCSFIRQFLLSPVCQSTTSLGEGPVLRPFHDLRFVPEASRPREQVENHGRAYTQVHFLRIAELGLFTF